MIPWYVKLKQRLNNAFPRWQDRFGCYLVLVLAAVLLAGAIGSLLSGCVVKTTYATPMTESELWPFGWRVGMAPATMEELGGGTSGPGVGVSTSFVPGPGAPGADFLLRAKGYAWIVGVLLVILFCAWKAFRRVILWPVVAPLRKLKERRS
jgi:hypothetical protein